MSLNIFATEINNLGKVIQDNVVKLQKSVVEAVVDHVATNTPVKTGQAAGNWQTTIGSPASSWTAGSSSAAASIANAKAALMGLKDGQDVYITNNVPYIVELNQGSSQQAPAAFVESAVLTAMGKAGNFNLLIK